MHDNVFEDIIVVFDAMYYLKRITMSKNKITTVTLRQDYSYYNAVEYLNLAENQVARVQDLEGLKNYCSLKHLDIAENPVAQEKGDDLKKEVLMLLSSAEYLKLNKWGPEGDEITEDELKDAKTEMEERVKAAEEARKEAEARAVAGEGGEKEEIVEE